MRVDYTISPSCRNWDCWVANLWRASSIIKIPSRIWRESVWAPKGIGPRCSTEGYSSPLVGDAQADDWWLGIVLEIDDGALQWFKGLSCSEIRWEKWPHQSFDRISGLMGIVTQRWVGPCFCSHSGWDVEILVCSDRVVQKYHHLGGFVHFLYADI